MDVTDLKVVAGKDKAELFFSCDPSDRVARVWARARNLSVSRDLNADVLGERTPIGLVADFASGLNLRVMTAAGDRRMTYDVKVDESAAVSGGTPVRPVKPEDLKTDEKPAKTVKPAKTEWPLPPYREEPKADSRELQALREEKLALEERVKALEAEAKAWEAARREQDEAMAALRAEKEAAESKARELEEKAAAVSEYAALRSSVDVLQGEVDRLRRQVNKLKNDQFELEEDSLPAAEADVKKAREALEKLTAEAESMGVQLMEAQEAALTKEKELESLKKRHTDANLALEELKAHRAKLGMNDEELLAAEKQLEESTARLAERQNELMKKEADLADTEKKLTETEAAFAAAEAGISSVEEKHAGLAGRVKQLEKEIATLTGLETQKAREWEEKVRKLSAILADVLQTQLDLRSSYELLTVSFKDETFTRIEVKAEENMAKLTECGRLLDEVNNWVRNIKAEQAEDE